MSLPTATDVRTFLEGYGITTTILSDAWITARMTKLIVPKVEKMIRRPAEGTSNVTEYLSGNGKSILMLSRRPVSALVSLEYVTGYNDSVDANIGLGGVRLIGDQGMIKSIANLTEGGTSFTFHKGNRNIKVVYTVGSATIESGLSEVIIMLTSEFLLGFIGARTGGGSLSVEGFSRNYGNRGKYQDIRNDLKRQAFGILKSKYMTAVVGSNK